MAERLLRDGVVPADPFAPDGVESDAAPDVIYDVYRGVPYVAVPTRPGESYHGNPWRGRMEASVREQLRARADAEGTRRAFEAWLKKYTGR